MALRKSPTFFLMVANLSQQALNICNIAFMNKMFNSILILPLDFPPRNTPAERSTLIWDFFAAG